MIRKSLSALIIGTFFLGSAAQSAVEPSARKIVQKTLPSVVLLLMEDAHGQQISLGSGFFVRDGVIAAGLHIIEGAHKGYYKHVARKKKYPLAGVVAIDRAHDLVLLAAPGARATPLLLGDSDDVAVGDSIYAVGNPRGYEGTFSQGIVSGIREADSRTLLQITAPVSQGSSGGPVLDANGRVIGMAMATHGGGQNLNFALPVAYVQALLANTRPITPLSAQKRNGVRKVVSRNAAQRFEDAVEGTHFTWDRYGREGRYYSFSLRNHLRQPVKEVYFMVAFYDGDGQPVHVQSRKYAGFIPAGLAKRMNGALEIYTSDLAERVDIKIVSFETVQ